MKLPNYQMLLASKTFLLGLRDRGKRGSSRSLLYKACVYSIKKYILLQNYTAAQAIVVTYIQTQRTSNTVSHCTPTYAQAETEQ